MKLNNPAPGRPVTSNYGWRIHPISKARKFHTGIDFGGTFNVEVAADGIVASVAPEWRNLSDGQKRRQSGGNTVVINHGEVHTAYFHGREQSKLKVGDRVKAGQLVFVAGSTGASTGPHLHFEVRTKQAQATHTDPNPYLNASPTKPIAPLPVDGRLSQRTWMAWQRLLKAKWNYTGLIDGIPGSGTWKAIQRSAVEYGYQGKIDGVAGPMTRKAVQRRLKVADDGVWGRVTISALQNRLNDGSY